MKEPLALLDLFLTLRESSNWAKELDEGLLLSFLQIGKQVYFDAGVTLVEANSEISYLYLFLSGVPSELGSESNVPFFWGLSALSTPFYFHAKLVAPENGTQVYLFPIRRLIAFLNEAPDLLIALIRAQSNG